MPDPPKGVAEMRRLVRPGGMVAAYAWDILGGGFTLEPLRIELRAMGIKPVDPPSVEASRIEAMRDLWTMAGLDAVETRQIRAHIRGFRGILGDHCIRIAKYPTDSGGDVAYGC